MSFVNRWPHHFREVESCPSHMTVPRSPHQDGPNELTSNIKMNKSHTRWHWRLFVYLITMIYYRIEICHWYTSHKITGIWKKPKITILNTLKQRGHSFRNIYIYIITSFSIITDVWKTLTWHFLFPSCNKNITFMPKMWGAATLEEVTHTKKFTFKLRIWCDWSRNIHNWVI